MPIAICLLAALAAPQAMAAPQWSLDTIWGPTNLEPGGEGKLIIYPRNTGTSASNGTVTVVDVLPPGVRRLPPKILDSLAGNPREAGPEGFLELGDGPGWKCSDVMKGGQNTVTCTHPDPMPSPGVQIFTGSGGAGPGGYFYQPSEAGYAEPIYIRVSVAPGASGTSPNVATISGGGAPSCGAPSAPPCPSDVSPMTISPDRAGFGFTPGSFETDFFTEEFSAGVPERQAGTHPFELRVNFDLNSIAHRSPSPTPLRSDALYLGPEDNIRTAEITLPRGFVGNPEATPKCEAADFAENAHGLPTIGTGCPAETQVGTVHLWLGGTRSVSHILTSKVPVYNLVPPRGVPADFGFSVETFKGHIYPSLDPSAGYAIKATVPYISELLPATVNRFTMWGVPADPRHDMSRIQPAGGEPRYGVPSTAPIRPLLTTPADCGASVHGSARAESWQEIGTFTPTVESASLQVSGCDDPRFRFEPEIRLQPTSRSAGGPTGLDVHLEVPQRDQVVDDVDKLYTQSGNLHGIDTPPMKKAVITFPEGMTLSTSAAQGLGVCTAAEIGIGTNDPVRCPENSRYGALTVHTPILPPDEPMVGDIFIAKKNDNPFNNFLSMYFVIHDEDRGLLIKIPGKVDLDPRTGQIRTTFDDLPRFPVEDLQLSFKSGVRAALVNPTTCGTKTIKAEFFSWHDPSTPHVVTNDYAITQKPNGSPCVSSLAERPFNPEFSAGTVNPNAGSYSPFVFRLTRTDDDQEFSQLSTTLPPGLLANISKITECPEAGIALAESKGRTGTAEQLFPSCPGSSLLGTTDVGSGVGQVITYIPGKAYLAGPYKGEPLSMVVITPILAGPYDLGVIAVRSAIHIDPSTAQASVQTEPFPQIYEGIPVRLRDIRVKVDRPNTTLNPTSCNPMAVSARVTGTGGNLDSTADDTAVTLSERFQAANCASLPFKPKLSFKLKGGTKRGDFPALEATLRARPGDANIARSTVVLPRSEFIEQGHIRTVCTRVQYAANQCPPGSIYGKASAKSPLFDETLSGPVYLRSNGGERLLPDLVVTLNGKIDVALAGFIDSVKGRVRNTFDVIPDAPVTEFKLQMQGGKRGLLVNHLDLCEITSRAEVKFIGQNGKVSSSRPKMGTSCKGKARKKHKKTTGRGASR